MATYAAGSSTTAESSTTTIKNESNLPVIDLTVKQETDAIPFIDLTLEPLLSGIGPGKKAFIDLTIENLREELNNVVIDLTEEEDIPKAIVDLNLKLYGPGANWKSLETKSQEWFCERKATLRKLNDSFFYTDASLEMCWQALRRSPRFNNIILREDPYIRLPVASGTWLRNLVDVPDDEMITIDVSQFPFPPGRLIHTLSTLQSYTMRVYRLINYSNLCEDRQRAAFDTLAFPIFLEINNSLLRYTQNHIFKIPQKLFPDQEILQLSLATLHRAMQFYQYMLFKPINQLDFYKLISSDMRNIDSMMKVFHVFIAVLETSERRSKRKRKSDCNNNETSQRASNGNVATQMTDNHDFPTRQLRMDNNSSVPMQRQTRWDMRERVDINDAQTRRQQADDNACKPEDEDKDAIKMELKDEPNFDIVNLLQS